MTVRAIFDKGVFRPVEPVDLPDQARVDLEATLVPDDSANSQTRADGGHEKVVEILSRRFNTAQTDAAARHDEHQP